jgi:hypothetical protein
LNLKSFAQQARTRLMEGVAARLLFWGFDANGNVLEEPQSISGGFILRGDVYDDPSAPELWKSLRSAVRKKGIKVVVEEAAYTWFNRIMAIKILSKNGYDDAVLDHAEGLDHTPLILQNARRGSYSFLNAEQQERIKEIITDYGQDQKSFSLLLTAYCQSHHTLSSIFGRQEDYTELLLPDDMLRESGFLHLLNTTDAISEEEYKQVELIGWLYQFYISEKKDEVFASFKKNKKAEAKDIPAATQIFTPNWIVKYMVENTAGKIWLDKHPDSPLRAKMKYLVENESDGQSESSAEQVRSAIISEVEELTLIDPACGSGHILVEGFELLYQMYMEAYYSPQEAVDSIIQNNLYGLDLDDRAAQLATFAVLLKAAQYDRDIWSRDLKPQVYSMPEPRSFGSEEVKDFLGTAGLKHFDQLDSALRLMQQAQNLGSIMKLRLTEEAQDFIELRVNELKDSDFRDFKEEAILDAITPFIPVLLLMTKKYCSVVANPPYMGQKNMNADLKAYVNKHYPMSKSDLFAVFMESTLAMTVKSGRMGMVNQHSWMFLSSYEKLRVHLLENHSIVNMLHLGPRTFEELSGEVVQSTAFVLANGGGHETGTYHRLVDEPNVHEKQSACLKQKSVFPNIPQSNFSKIPGSPIAYWISRQVFSNFLGSKTISHAAETKKGILTGKDSLFVRLWFELVRENIDFTLSSNEKMMHTNPDWIPVTNGGTYRKWYGNYEAVVNYKDDALAIKTRPGNNFRLRSKDYYFLEGVTWSEVASKASYRFVPKSVVYGNSGPMLFSDARLEILGLLNSKVASRYLEIFSPTLTFGPEQVKKIPFLKLADKLIVKIEACIATSKLDWDSRETSWDFEQSPLLNESHTLESAFYTWFHKASDEFFQLHKNEEELNRIFIDLYGLQDELTPEVPLRDITILQEELDGKDLEALESTFREHGGQPVELPIDRDEVMQQFLSYCVGLMMGRYRLDKPGLNIAHPNPSSEELSSYEYNGHTIEIDDDAILPLMGSGCQFPDDVLHRLYSILDAIWGSETRTENLNFMEECLGKDLEKYLIKDFFSDHCKRYKKKPIYWLFSSKKGAFQVLVYMHRMNAFTVEKIRANYLIEHIKHLREQVDHLSSNESSLSSKEARKLEQLRKDLQECLDYDLILKDVADQQIEFDLDDGVTANHKLFEGVVAKIK